MRKYNQKAAVPISVKKDVTPEPEIEVSLEKPANIITTTEIKKEDINIDEVIEKKLAGKKRIINLDDTKKKKEKKEYDLDDVVIREITLTGNIHARLISNANGYFIDLRRYMRTFPTKKGIRILASKFIQAYDFLKKDYEELVKPAEINKKEE